MMKTLFSLFITAVLSLLTFSAFAIPPFGPDMIRTSEGPINEWEVTYYQDQDSGFSGITPHTEWATQRLCFYYAGTADSHQRYYVVSSTYKGWFGTATQEGDLVRIKMTFWNGEGNDEIYFDLTTVGPKDRGMGHWDETVETWSTFGTTFWGNTELRRVGRCEIGSQGEFTVNEFELAEEMRRLMGGNSADIQQRTPSGLHLDWVKQTD